jgi:hypothetical protein
MRAALRSNQMSEEQPDTEQQPETEQPKKMVRVKTKLAHSILGEEHAVDDEYDVEAQYVDTLVMQGKAYPVET